MKKIISYALLMLSLILTISSCSRNKAKNENSKTIAVWIKENASAGTKTVVLLWDSLFASKESPNYKEIKVRDLTNSSLLNVSVYDTNNDKKPDYIAFPFNYTPDEPLRSFEIQETECEKQAGEMYNGIPPRTKGIKINYLTSASGQNSDSVKWAEKIADTYIQTYPNSTQLEVFSRGQWSYTNGFFLNAMWELYKNTGDKKYRTYVKNWADRFIMENGHLDTIQYEAKKQELDEVLPGRMLLFLYQDTKDEKYKTAASDLLLQMQNQPKTSDGGFWHKRVYTTQMWLDGIYMGDVFLAQYGSVFNQPEYIDLAVQQFILIHKHTFDPKTGLLFHGWDESKNKFWANQETGCAPNFWGRGLGWYAMALVDLLDYMPENHPRRPEILKITKDLAASLVKFQDENTGQWFQVIDKANVQGNWPETSATAMFSYMLAKGVKKGYLDSKTYKPCVQKAMKGMIDNYIFFDETGRLYLTQTVKVGTLSFKNSDASFNYYISVDRRINDTKGVAALFYLAMYL